MNNDAGLANPDRERDRRKRFTIGAHRIISVSNMQGVCVTRVLI
jgi:hypothetical protein